MVCELSVESEGSDRSPSFTQSFLVENDVPLEQIQLPKSAALV